MTREEAIKFLNEQKEFLLKGCFWEETRMNINEAFDMAIEALEADVPDTNVGDTISRQAAIDAINHICPVDTEYDCTLLDRVDVRCVLSDLPSVQPEKCEDCGNFNKTRLVIPQPEIRKGKWIGGELGYCTCCGHEGCASDMWSRCEKPHCPNCGAEMEGVQT